MHNDPSTTRGQCGKGVDGKVRKRKGKDREREKVKGKEKGKGPRRMPIGSACVEHRPFVNSGIFVKQQVFLSFGAGC